MPNEYGHEVPTDWLENTDANVVDKPLRTGWWKAWNYRTPAVIKKWVEFDPVKDPRCLVFEGPDAEVGMLYEHYQGLGFWYWAAVTEQNKD